MAHECLVTNTASKLSWPITGAKQRQQSIDALEIIRGLRRRSDHLRHTYCDYLQSFCTHPKGRHFAVLIGVALGRKRVLELGKAGRDSLREFIFRSHESLLTQKLERFVDCAEAALHSPEKGLITPVDPIKALGKINSAFPSLSVYSLAPRKNSFATWSEDGVKVLISHRDFGFVPGTIALIDALSTEPESIPLTVKCTLAMSASEERMWKIQGFRLALFFLPKHQHFERIFTHLLKCNRNQYSGVIEVLKDIESGDPEAPPLLTKEDYRFYFLVLLAATKLTDSNFRLSILCELDRVKGSVQDISVLKMLSLAEKTYLRSTLERAQLTSRQAVLGNPTRLCSAIDGQLSVAEAIRQVARDNLSEAERILATIPRTPCPYFSEVTEFDIKMQTARLCLLRGDFQAALPRLKTLLHNEGQYSAIESKLAMNIARAEAELGHVDKAHITIDRVLRKDPNVQVPRVRSLLITKAELYLMESPPILSKAAAAISHFQNLDYFTVEYDCIRLKIVQGRVAQAGRDLACARACWEYCIRMPRTWGWKRGLSEAIGNAAMAVLYLQQGDINDALKAFNEACSALEASQKAYWYLGVVSQWLPVLLEQLSRVFHRQLPQGWE